MKKRASATAVAKLSRTEIPRLRREANDAPVANPRAGDLLAWYDRHRRVLPWRALPGEHADPYRVWLSEIMLQQTTVATVVPYYERFLARFPNVQSLAVAPLADVLAAWAGLGYYSRARNLHACAKMIVEEHGGQLPRSEAELARLPGIGPYTAAAIAAIAFDEKAVPVDGNVERVVARLHRVKEALPAAKPLLRKLAQGLAEDVSGNARFGDLAQALMDLGATLCRPGQPLCMLCPWRDACRAFAHGDPESFPRKSAKREGKLRRGAAFVLVRQDGAILVRSRAETGLLGGMTEVPGSEWAADFDEEFAMSHAPSLAGEPRLDWRRLDGEVRHVFTHFPLELAVFVASASHKARAPRGCRFLPSTEIASAALPTLMMKVLAFAGALAHVPRSRASLS
ncbi:MAG: A/G-specific adenine glycosylase [Hyphomicrobiales bacterium]|nr:A/G-specific adenine glycosylase [Hyphomicrobiales bacterium]